MKFTNEQIEYMRGDLESDMGYSKIIENTKKRFLDEGRDFGKELEEWKNREANKK